MMREAYVALSRATSMAQLQVLNFDPAKFVSTFICFVYYANLLSFRVVAHPRVLAWHNCEPEKDMYIDDDDEMENEEAMAAYYMT